MNKSQYIRNTKQGLAQYYRAYSNRTTGDRERLPVMTRNYYARTQSIQPLPKEQSTPPC